MFSMCIPYSQMRSPGLRTVLDGKPKTLYMQTVASLKEATKGNLKKTLKGENQVLSIQRIKHPSGKILEFQFVLVCIT